MTVVTVRPDQTLSNGFTVAGAASAHGAVSDNSDGSYLNTTGAQHASFGCVEPTLPAGAKSKSVALRVRDISGLSGGFYNNISIAGVGLSDVHWGAVNPTTHTLGVVDLASVPAAVTCAFSAGTHGAAYFESVSVYEVYADFTYVTKPVIDVTLPTEGATYVEDNAPDVAWTRTSLDTDGGPQTKYRIKIFSAAQYGAGGFNPDTSTPTVDSGELSGADLSWINQVALPNATYRAYVRIGQTVGGTTHWSDWTYNTFTINVLPTNPPTLTVLEDEDGRVRLRATSAGTGAATDAIEFNRSADGGATWTTVRTTQDYGRGTPVGGVTDVWDYEGGNGDSVLYTARAVTFYPNSIAYSAWVGNTPGSWSSEVWWLKHPFKPALNMPLTIYSQASLDRRGRVGTFQPLGGLHPIAVTDTRESAQGALTVLLDTKADQDSLKALLDDGVALLLQAPTVDNWDDRWVAIIDQSEQRLVDKLGVVERFEELSWREVARPPGNVDAWS